MQTGQAGDVGFEVASGQPAPAGSTATPLAAARSARTSSCASSSGGWPRRPCRRSRGGRPPRAHSSISSARPASVSRALSDPGLVVEAGVDDAGVVPVWWRAMPGSLSRTARCRSGRSASERPRRGQADDAGAHDGDVDIGTRSHDVRGYERRGRPRPRPHSVGDGVEDVHAGRPPGGQHGGDQRRRPRPAHRSAISTGKGTVVMVITESGKACGDRHARRAGPARSAQERHRSRPRSSTPSRTMRRTAGGSCRSPATARAPGSARRPTAPACWRCRAAATSSDKASSTLIMASGWSICAAWLRRKVAAVLDLDLGEVPGQLVARWPPPRPAPSALVGAPEQVALLFGGVVRPRTWTSR